MSAIKCAFIYNISVKCSGMGWLPAQMEQKRFRQHQMDRQAFVRHVETGNGVRQQVRILLI